MRTLTIHAAWTLLLCMCPSLIAQEAPPDRGLMMIPVKQLLFSEGVLPAPRMNTLLMAEEVPRRLLSAREFRVLQAGQLVNLVRSAVGEDIDSEGVSLQMIGSVLMATGPREVLSAVEKEVQGIAAVMGQRLQLEARLYQATGHESYPAVIKGSDLGEATGSLPLLWEAHAVSYSGQQVAMAQERFTGYVRGATGEVATKAKIGNPEVESVFEGVRLLVESHALVGGKEAVIMCQFAIGDLREPIAQRATGVAELPVLGSPRLNSNFGSFAGRLSKGDALAMQLQSSAGSGSSLLLVLRIDDGGNRGDTRGSGATGPDNMAILPISALTSNSLLELTEGFDELGGTTGHLPVWNAFGEDSQGRDVPEADAIVHLLASSLNLGRMEDTSVELVAGYILLKAKAGIRARAIRLLQQLENRWLQTVEVRATTTLTPVEGSTGALVRHAAKGGSRPYQAVTFPTLPGRSHLLVKGVEACTTRDFEPQIAEESAMLNPVVANVFSGVIVNIRPRVAWQEGQKEVGMEASLKLHLSHVTTDIRQPTEQKEGGQLFLPTVNRAYFGHTGGFKHGLDVSLGWGPVIAIDKQRYRMHQSIRLRKP